MVEQEYLKVIKRDGSVDYFDDYKVQLAVTKANDETKEMTREDIVNIVSEVVDSIEDNTVSVEVIQDLVEDELMFARFTQTAKAYILYRDKKKRERKKDIFKPRRSLKPYEYPELELYKEAIQHSYWLHTEFSFTSDIQDFKVKVKPHERTAIKNAMLAISQVEVDVKTFWANLFSRLPKPELANVGMTFAESEVRHSDAYSHLLELLGLNGEFERIDEIPALKNRINYLKKHNHFAQTGSDRDYAVAILLFSAFIEHISLFSQFLIIMSFNKQENLFSGISNVIEATSKEEQLHGQFGIELINVIKEENPQWFDAALHQEIYDLCKQAYESELEVLDWIFEDGELNFLSKYTVQEFIKNRLNNSLEGIGLERIFEVDDSSVDETSWFEDEILGTKHQDFFSKRPVNYTKRNQSYSAEDLF